MSSNSRKPLNKAAEPVKNDFDDVDDLMGTGKDEKVGVQSEKEGMVSKYAPLEHEKGLYHVVLDKPGFDPKSGRKLSKAFTQKFTKADWAQTKLSLASLGYEYEIIWDPEKDN